MRSYEDSLALLDVLEDKLAIMIEKITSQPDDELLSNKNVIKDIGYSMQILCSVIKLRKEVSDTARKNPFAGIPDFPMSEAVAANQCTEEQTA